MDFIDISGVLQSFIMQSNASEIFGPALNSLNQLSAQIVATIPRVISASIILLIGFIIGRTVGWGVSKILSTMKFEDALDNTGLGKVVSRSGWNMTRIISTVVKWFIYIFFITAAVNALQFTQLADALTSIWLWIPNLVAFIVILIIGSIIAEFVGNWAQRELPARGVPGGRAIGLGAKGILYTIVFVTAITQLQIGAGILNIVISALVWGVAGAIAIGLGVALAYGLKDILPSIIHGTANIKSTLKPGQKVRINGTTGTIRQAGTLQIILENEKGETVVVPTKSIVDKEIVIESGPPPEITEEKLKDIAQDIEDKNTAATEESETEPDPEKNI